MFRRRTAPDAEAVARARLNGLAHPPPQASASPQSPHDAPLPSRVLEPGPVSAEWILAPVELAENGAGRETGDAEQAGGPRHSAPAADDAEGEPEWTPDAVRGPNPAAGGRGEVVGGPSGGLPPRTGASRFGAVAEAALPAALRGARVDPGRRGVLAIALVALVAAAVAGIGAWQARPTPEPLGVPMPEQSQAAPSTAPQLVVAVAGKVRRPGVVRLPAGSRVADAVAAAGGALPGADLALLNLARKLVDGEQVVVGIPASAAPAGGAPVPGAPAAPGALLNLNTATVEQFDTLPGVGPVLAQRLVEYRTAHGGFRSVDQLREVDGIGESRFQRLKELVTA